MKDILERAQANYKADKDYWQENYNKSLEDQRFLSDDLYAQWDRTDYNSRIQSGRPCLTIDQLGQFIHQVSNDIRMNTPAINVLPSGTEASVDTAEVMKGLIKNIEYVSAADAAYDTASLNSIRSAIGFIRVDHDYEGDEGDEQQLLIKRVINPLNCYIDCNSVEADASDAMHGTIIESIQVKEFKRKYPDAEVSSFAEDKAKEYKDGEWVNIAEYFEIKKEGRKKVVYRYILSGTEVIKDTIFPGKYVPLVPVYGEETWVDGKRQLCSLIRKSKDAQRMFNYWKSLETELLMKQPNAPIMAAVGQTEDYKEDWVNPAKAAVLRYNQTDAKGNPAPAPQRLAPPTIPTGIVNASRATVDDIKATMGLYSASIGARSNETSGIAIERRNQEGEVATFHFADNLNRAIAQVGRILVCAIPEVYDTARVVRIIGTDEKPKIIGVNGVMTPEQKVSYDLRKGKYDVKVISGPSFTTQRQEAASFFSNVVSKQPELMQVMGDLLFRNMDFTGAEVMAERMEKMIAKTNPDLLTKEEGVSPEVMALQQALQQAQQQMQAMQAETAQIIEQGKKEIETLQMKLENKETENLIKGKSEQVKSETETGKLELEALKLQREYEFKMAALQIKARELDLKEAAMIIERADEAAPQELGFS